MIGRYHLFVTGMGNEQWDEATLTYPGESDSNRLGDMDGIMHPFWQHFPDTPYFIHAVIGSIMVVIGLMAITGNLLVIIVFIR